MTRKLKTFSTRDLLAVGVPAVLLVVAAFWFAAQFVKPAPPDALVISTGGDGGAYQYYAARYKPLLAQHGIELVERPSVGSLENLSRLLDPNSGVDVGFVQGGTAAGDGEGRLQSLGSLYYEPLWIFYRGAAGLNRLEQLRGKRIAIGPEGSGNRVLALALLEAHGIAAAPTVLVPLGGLAAAGALQRGEIDVVFAVGAAQSGAVWTMFYSPGIALFDFSLAEAYTRRFGYLSKLVLPQGAIDLVQQIPPRDIRLIAPVASLVVDEETHPALIDLLLGAMMAVHGEHGLFQKAGEFPAARKSEFQIHRRAARYFESGPPFLQRYLPFWVANAVDRLLVMLVPIVAILFPLFRVTPQVYSWRVRSRIYRWYGELKFLEVEAERNPAARSREEWMEAVDRIERAVNRVPTPLAFADYLYNLRTHIALVRQRLGRLLGVAD
jgi:TRAP transporter TAXI family solute receptor